MKPRKGIHILPSLFTTGNVFCGFYSFIAALNNQYYLAAWAIVLAIVFDFLDGRIARMTKTTSAFGMQVHPKYSNALLEGRKGKLGYIRRSDRDTCRSQNNKGWIG